MSCLRLYAAGRLGRRAVTRQRLARPTGRAASAPLLFYRRNQNNQTPPNVIRRHREDIFHTTCTVCKDFDRRDSSTTPAASLGMTITSVTLSGASAESKGLEFAEHSPVRFARALDISPSRPLGFARGDSFRCHVERRGLGPEVETSRLDGASTIATRTGSRPSDRRDSSTAPALGMTITSVTLSGATAESKGLEFAEHAPVRFARALAISPSRPLDFARGDSLCCHVERSDSEVETSRLDGTFTFTNHTRNAHNAETNINDRSRCSIIPRLERGMPAVDGFVTYHSTFSSLDGGAFHPLRAILHTIGRHALILSAIPGGHAVFENSSTLYIGTSAEEELCARIECLASAGRSPFYHTFGEACPFRACRFNRALP